MDAPNFSQRFADLHVPSGERPERALRRTTHLCLAAHADDLEFMAYQGIAACYAREDAGFTGVVLTDGVGSTRQGPYAHYSDAALREARRREQRAAAAVGQYTAVAQLAWPSDAVKGPLNEPLVDELGWLLERVRPEIVYLHNPFDRHPTHLGVLRHSLEALRRRLPQHRPQRLLGCEGWRDLDWLPQTHRVELDVSDRPHLAAALNGVFDSQIAGGKRYDRAVLGRRHAHATFSNSHAADGVDALTLAIDLMPLLDDPKRSLASFAKVVLDAFQADVLNALAPGGNAET
ncbi:MAG: PIG-L deacetylase family protein [Opitutales bacterium]